MPVLTSLHNQLGIKWFNLFTQVINQLAWRFIFAGIMISPFILLIIWLRGKFSPKLRSYFLGACFFGLFLPFQRVTIYSFSDVYIFFRSIRNIVLIPVYKLGYGIFDTVSYDIFDIVAIIWFIGFIAFFAVKSFDYRTTVKLLKEGKLRSPASYFYRFRSRIYLPPDFETAYSTSEQEMLLAHEKQHIKQHDPFVYRFLALLECACWFNPLVSVAVRHYQHERELLCDERVTQSFSKYDYGILILKAAGKKLSVRAATAGIVMGHSSVSERLTAMIEPMKTVGKRTATAVICLTLLQLGIGFMGFIPAYRSLGEYPPEVLDYLGFTKEAELRVYRFESMEEAEAANSQNAERLIEGEIESFISATKDGFRIDEEGMYAYAVSIGMTDENCLHIEHISSIRLDLGGGATTTYEKIFLVGDLKTQEVFFDYSAEKGLYPWLTDIFL